jgi:integrase/recombinase XerD
MTPDARTKKRAKKAQSLTPVKIQDGYLVNVPASESLSGKRQRLKFPNKKKADLEIERIKGMNKRWGTESSKLSASDAEDATKALELLDGRNVTLLEVASHWLELKQQQERSCTFAELWKIHLEEKLNKVSDAYAKALEYYGEPILKRLGKATVSEITSDQIEKTFNKSFNTDRQRLNAMRTIRPAFSYAVKKKLATTNPFTGVEMPEPKKQKICAITVDQAKAAFNACTDHREDKNIKKSYRLNCEDCMPAVAIMLFAGVRPKETERLDWSAVHFDHGCITISEEIAKTRSIRNIPMEPNLIAWLETVPESERQGSIIPLNWKEKIKAIRFIAGFSDMQDALRHSFASYHLVAFVDSEALQESMGHSTDVMIHKRYRTLVHKKDAVKFWSIFPDSTEAKLKAGS